MLFRKLCSGFRDDALTPIGKVHEGLRQDERDQLLDILATVPEYQAEDEDEEDGGLGALNLNDDSSGEEEVGEDMVFLFVYQIKSDILLCLSDIAVDILVIS
jgi:hypothetical protein